MGASRKDIARIVEAADKYANTVSDGDKDKYMPLFIKAMMDGVHAVDPDMAQRLKKIAMEKANG